MDNNLELTIDEMLSDDLAVVSMTVTDLKAALRAAQPLRQDLMPNTQAATAMVNEIAAEIIGFGRKKQRRSAAAIEAHRAAVASTLASLLTTWLRAPHGAPEGRNEPSETMSYQPMEKRNFSGQPTSFRTFQSVLRGLVDVGLVDRKAAFTRFLGPAGDCLDAQRWAQRLWPSDRLLARAAAAGITTATVSEHFISDPQRRPKAVRVVVNAISPRHHGQKVKVKSLPVPKTPDFDRVSSEVQEMNDFVSRQKITMKPPGAPVSWYRKFNIDLDLHGRWYAVGEGSYQTFKGATRRHMIYINGEDCAEVDLAGSHISIVSAYLGQPLDPSTDPYAVPDIPRDLVKQFIVAAIGAGKAPKGKRWPRMVLTTAADRGIDLACHTPDEVAKPVLKKHPVLEDLAGHFGFLGGRYGVAAERVIPLFIMGMEARVVTSAMLALKDGGIVALPVHDSLIVQAKAASIARAALTTAFKDLLGTEPRLSVKGPLGPHDAAWCA